MFFLNCKIEIKSEGKTKFVFDSTPDILVETSVENFTDTCKVKIPRRYAMKKKVEINPGDEITLQLGYKYKDVIRLQTVFTGYVKKISATPVMDIECENKAYLLKNISLQDAISKEVSDKYTLKELLSVCMKESTIKDADIHLAPNFPEFAFRDH